MNRKTLLIVTASLLVAGSLGAQQPKPAAKKVAPTVAAAPAAPVATPADTTHKKPVKKSAKKVAAKHDSTAKHDTTHAAPKKPVKGK